MLLQINNISKSYTSGGTVAQQVLKNVSLILETAVTKAITGPSGCGKTTLLNIIGTLDKPDSGEILYKNENIALFDVNKAAKYRNREIGFIFQMHYLLPQFSVLENVLMPKLPQKRKTEKEDIEFAEHLLEEVQMLPHRHKYPNQLSGGECQRIALVRALINKPDLLLADEPTGSLDEKNADIVSDLLLQLNQKHKTSLLVVTHSKKLADKMNSTFTLANGELL